MIIDIELNVIDELTDEEIQTIKENLERTHRFIYRDKYYEVSEDTMKEREILFNKVSTFLTDKERMNQLIIDYKKAYGLYETVKAGGVEKINFLNPGVSRENYKLALKLETLCNAIYLMTYGFQYAYGGFGIFEDIRNVECFVIKTPSGKDEKPFISIDMNDDTLFVNETEDVQKVIEQYDERFAVSTH